METTSKDGIKDLITGLIVLVVFSLIAYVGLTNITLILDNGLLIIVVVFVIGMMMTIGPRVVQMVKTSLSDQSQPQQDEPPQGQQQPDQVKMSTELEDFTQ